MKAPETYYLTSSKHKEKHVISSVFYSLSKFFFKNLYANRSQNVEQKRAILGPQRGGWGYKMDDNQT
jgi:recombinational DNA repair ATPase RecF